jgi:hypothetical protein
MPQPISPGFLKLLREPAFCQLATLMPDGSPQITQVWVETDGEHILINTPRVLRRRRTCAEIRAWRSTWLTRPTAGA